MGCMREWQTSRRNESGNMEFVFYVNVDGGQLALSADEEGWFTLRMRNSAEDNWSPPMVNGNIAHNQQYMYTLYADPENDSGGAYIRRGLTDPDWR